MSFLYWQVADIAVRYQSCENRNHSSLDKNLPSHLWCCQSVLLPGYNTDVCEVCLSLSHSIATDPQVNCVFPSMVQGRNVLQLFLRDCCLHQESVPVSINTSSAGCCNFMSSYNPFSQYSACCRKSQPQLNESQAKEEREMQRGHLKSASLSFPPSSGNWQQGEDGITGLQCQTNRTLRFYVLDVALNWPLAMRLGAAGSRSILLCQGSYTQKDDNGDGSFAAIVSLKDEVHYVLQRSPATTLAESLGKTRAVFYS